MVRILIGAIVGGLLMLGVGAAAHMGLNAESRNIQRVPGEEAAVDSFNSQELTAGMYSFSTPAEGFESMSAAEYEAEYSGSTRCASRDQPGI